LHRHLHGPHLPSAGIFHRHPGDVNPRRGGIADLIQAVPVRLMKSRLHGPHEQRADSASSGIENRDFHIRRNVQRVGEARRSIEWIREILIQDEARGQSGTLLYGCRIMPAEKLDALARSQVPRILLVLRIVPMLVDSEALKRSAVPLRIVHRTGRGIPGLGRFMEIIVHSAGHDLHVGIDSVLIPEKIH